MFKGEFGSYETHNYESEEKPDRTTLIKEKLAENSPELEVSKGSTETTDSRDFIANKEQFETDLILYCDGILDYLKQEIANGSDLDDFVLVFPGRSGLGIEIPVRESIKGIFGHTPLGVRIPTESELDNRDEIYLSREEGFAKMPVPFKQEGKVENWDRDKIFTPQLDKIFSGQAKRVLICDAIRASGRTMKQIMFTLKPYSIPDITLVSPCSTNQELGLGAYRKSPFTLEDNSDANLRTGTDIEELKIALGHTVNFDHISRRTMWLATGVTKAPVAQRDLRSQIEYNPEAKELGRRIKEEADSFQGTSDEEYEEMFHRLSELEGQQQKIIVESGKIPPPLEFIKGPKTVSLEDRTAIRRYLKQLAGLAVAIYNGSEKNSGGQNV